MALPKFQELMLPALTLLADDSRTDHGMLTGNSVTELLAKELALTDEDWGRELSGGMRQFPKNVSFALSYLTMAGLANRPRKRTFEITKAGRKLLAEKPDYLDLNKLKKISPELHERMERNNKRWQERAMERKRQSEMAGGADGQVEETLATQESARERDPYDRIKEAFEDGRRELEAELLDRVLKLDPTDFEKLVIELMLEMGYGYGGDKEEAGKHRGQPGDGGIDGEIYEDKLGLQKIALQAKHFNPDYAVGAEEVRSFLGAMDADGTVLGVFFTTSRFTKDAQKMAANSPKSVRLIGGEELASLMRKHGIGVRTERGDVFHFQRVDEDYFPTEQP